MDEDLSRFREHLRDYERLTPSTVYAWVTYTSRLLAFVDDPVTAASGAISGQDLSGWLRKAEEDGYASGTRQHMWYAVRAYYRWLAHEGYTGPSPLGDVRPPRARHAPRSEYTREEAEAVLAIARDRARQGGWRDVYDYTLLSVLRYTGARSAEVAGARVDALDLERRNLSVLGKGAKRRGIPLPRACVEDLRTHLTDARVHLPESPFLFPSRRPGPSTRPSSISTAWVQVIVRRFGEAAGIKGPHHPHRWRHTYATHLLRSGVDVVVVRDLLGHTDVATTSIYLHLLRDDLRDGVERGFS